MKKTPKKSNGVIKPAAGMTPKQKGWLGKEHFARTMPKKIHGGVYDDGASPAVKTSHNRGAFK